MDHNDLIIKNQGTLELDKYKEITSNYQSLLPSQFKRDIDKKTNIIQARKNMSKSPTSKLNEILRQNKQKMIEN